MEVFEEACGPDYPLLEAILDAIPLNEGLNHAIRLRYNEWIRRIINILILELISECNRRTLHALKPPAVSDLERKGSWNLIETVLDEGFCRS